MKRLAHFIAGGALVAVALGVVAAQAQQQQPPFATTKVDGTNNVYVFRYGNHQSMFVVTTAGVIATDPISYGRPQAATSATDKSSAGDFIDPPLVPPPERVGSA